MGSQLGVCSVNWAEALATMVAVRLPSGLMKMGLGPSTCAPTSPEIISQLKPVEGPSGKIMPAAACMAATSSAIYTQPVGQL